MSTGGGWVGAWLQRRWAKKDRSELTTAERQKETDARVFEHKMPAYLAVMNKSAQFGQVSSTGRPRAVRTPLPTMRELIPLLEAIDRVMAFGAVGVSTAAEALALEHELLVTGHPTPEHLNEHMRGRPRRTHDGELDPRRPRRR